MNGMATVADRDYIQAQQHGLPLTKAGLTITASEYPTCQLSAPYMALFLEEIHS